MRFARRHRGRGTTALAAGAAFFLAACSSDPLDPGNGNGDDHADPAGVRLVADGVPLIEYMDGDPDPEVPPLPANYAASVGITFLDADGDPVELPADEPFELEVTIGDEAVLSWTPGQAGAPGTTPHFQGTLQTGAEAGTTTVQLELVHEDHAEWTSPVITVMVE